jgi:outer membrane protein, heavy metal efflux system
LTLDCQPFRPKQNVIKVSLTLFSLCIFLQGIFSPLLNANVPLELIEIQKRARANSLYIQSQAKETESERIKSEGTGILPNPILIIQGGREDTGPISGSIWDITLSQTFPFPGKLAIQKRLQRIQAELSEATEEGAKLLIQHEVTLVAARVAMWNEIAKHSYERRRRFRIVQNFIKSHPQASPSQKVEAALIENQIRLLEKGILQTDRNKKVAELELNLYLQLPSPPELIFEWVKSPKVPNKADLEKAVLEKNWEWKKSHLEVERASEQVKKAEKDSLPDFNLGLNYRVENVIPQNNFYSGSLGISLPIWDHGQYSRPAMRAKLEKEILRQDFLRQKLKKDLEVATIKLETALEMLRLFPMSLIPISELKFNEAEMQLEKGRVSISPFLQIDAQVHENLDSIFAAQVDYLESLSQVLILAGYPMEYK